MNPEEQKLAALWLETIPKEDGHWHSDSANEAYCEICRMAGMDLDWTLHIILRIMAIDSSETSMVHLASGPISSLFDTFSERAIFEAIEKLPESDEKAQLLRFVKS